MRIGLVFVATGVALTAWAIASAQDGAAARGGRTMAFPSQGTPVRSANHPAEVPGVPNYYGQLFDEPAADAAGKAVVRMAGGSESDMMPTFQAGYEQDQNAAPHGTIRQVTAQRNADVTPVRQRDEPQSASNPFTRTAAGSSPTDAHSTFGTQAKMSAVPTLPAASELTNVDGPAHRLAMAQSSHPAAVEATWERVGEITVGRECRCELVVKNHGSGAAGAVTVEAYFPSSVRLTNADPPPEANSDRLTWSIPSLAAGAETRIAVSLIPSAGGDLELSAIVRSTETVATTLAVREPMLHVAVNGPEQVTIGETMSQTIVVSNPGTGTTEEVLVEITLPPGLEHGKGRTVTMPIGALAAKQSHSIPLTLFATQGGPQAIRVRTAAGPALRHETTFRVVVETPTLKVAADGPSLRFIGRNAAYTTTVINDGAAAANNVRVSHAVPKGFDFVSAAKGGRFDAGSREIVWYVGRVEAGQSVELIAQLTATGLGEHRHLVTVTGDGGARSEAAVETAVDGTASLVVEVLDLDDPIELGAETAYEVRVRNEGTKPAKNVEVSCQVPAGVATLAARGPTTHRGQGSALNFQPIEQLEPGTTALYRIVVRGTAPGKHRFRVRLTSDSIDEPLIHEELTHYYAD